MRLLAPSLAAILILQTNVLTALTPDATPADIQTMDGQHLTDYLRHHYSGLWVMPANTSHILLAEPGSPELDKTFVEPDGSFSPGVGSYGITTWLYNIQDNRLFAPEEMPQESIEFHLENNYIPIAVSVWKAGRVTVTKRIAAGTDISVPIVYSDLSVKNEGTQPADFWVYVAVRSLGPAGGPLNNISTTQNLQTVQIDQKPVVQFDRTPAGFGATSFGRDGDDISVWAKRGTLPTNQQSSDSLGLASGAVRYRVHLKAGQTFKLSLRCAVRNKNRSGFLEGAFAQKDADEAFSKVIAEWKDLFNGTKVIAADPFGHDMFDASVAYILMNSVENQLRVATVSYPVSYLRDGVFMLDALEEAGLQDRAHKYLNYFLDHPWTGAQSQQGPEADAPGELCWIIGEHYRFTRDLAWLRSVYPQLKQEADLIVFMRNPHDGETHEVGGAKLTARGNKVYASMNSSLNGIQEHSEVELSEAREGIIIGRLDWHLYAGTTSSFSVAGLMSAWEAAEAVGDHDSARIYMTEYFSLRQALNIWMKTHPDEFAFGSGIWPTKAFDSEQSYISNIHQEDSYAQVASNDYHQLEDTAPDGRYFYVLFGSAHSLFRMGYTNEMYTNFLNPFLNSKFSRSTNEAYGYTEYSPPDADVYEARHWPELWADIRGWTDLGNVMPHGWTSADVALIIRDLLYYEDGQSLVIAGGKLLDKMAVGESIGVDNGATYFGRLTYHLSRETSLLYRLTISGDAAPLNGYVLDTDNRLDVESIVVDGQKYSGQWGRRIYIPRGTKEVMINLAGSPLQVPRKIMLSSPPIVGDVESNAAAITWTTSEPALTKVVCGIGKSRGYVVIDYALSAKHAVTLKNLVPGQTYSCEVYTSAGERAAISTFTTSR
jgi:hypothetical protein